MKSTILLNAPFTLLVNKTLLVVFLCLLAAPSGFCEPQENHLIPLTGLYHRSPTEILLLSGATYWIGYDQLRASPPWNLEQRFPLNLALESQRAASILSTNEYSAAHLDLQCVRIRRYRIPARGSGDESALSLSGLSNRWYVIFTFSTDLPGELLSPAVLLDGTSVKAHAPKTALSRNMKFNQLVLGTLRDTKEEKAAFSKLNSPNLSLSSVQWDPSTCQCPFDVEQLAKLGNDYLIKKYSLSSAQCELNQMEFFRFVPSEAIKAQKAKLINHLHHWFCIMTFTTGDGLAEYRVLMLLDGTIVQGDGL